VPTDYSIIGNVFEMQRALLAQLMSDGVAARLLDSEGKVAPTAAGKPGDSFRLSELYARLTREVWSDLGGGDIAAQRRELQREHLNRLSASLLRPSGGVRADIKALQREQARELLVRIGTAQKRSGLSAETRAHLAEGSETLTQALAARLQRAGI
jgi:hypothetical protein